MTTPRWVFSDPVTSESWTMPINPDSATSPHPTKTIKTAFGVRRGNDRFRTILNPPTPVEWQWSGAIRSKAHHDQLLAWAERPGLVHVADHLGRTWEVIFSKFDPTDRRPTPNTPWRQRYTMTALILRRVS